MSILTRCSSCRHQLRTRDLITHTVKTFCLGDSYRIPRIRRVRVVGPILWQDPLPLVKEVFLVDEGVVLELSFGDGRRGLGEER
jgi:hypothetical protein